MRIRIACLDYDLLWVIDDIISGLYLIDQKTLKTKCMIDYQKLFPYGKFEVQSLLKWKENYIIIIPREISKSWIFYNKITGEVEYRKVIKEKWKEILIAVDQNREQLYFCPLYIYDPILIVDLNTLTCFQIIENWSKKVISDCREVAWKGGYNGKYVFFPIKGTKILVRINCETRTVDLRELNISENLIDIDYAFEELWVLPINGNKIYQIDEDGKIINTIELFINSIPSFARIVVQKRYLFFIPFYRKGIYVYDKLEKKIHIILEENLNLEENKEYYLRYWEYCVKDNQICFLPFRDKYMEVDLDTLTYKKKELFYPDIWSDEEKIYRYVGSHISEQSSVICEADECSLRIFLKYIQYKANIKNFSKSEYIGEKLWKILET